MNYCWTCFKLNGFDVPVSMMCVVEGHEIKWFGEEE